MNNDTALKVIAIILVVTLSLAFTGWMTTSIWNECKDAGHSTLYCLKVISR